ncbi:hypothetical protein EMIT0P258_120044 [Pseudomonas sp. IT-P258]
MRLQWRTRHLPGTFRQMHPTPGTVAILAYDGLCTFEFGIAVEIFGLPRPEFDFPWYEHCIVAVDQGPMRAMGGIQVLADGGMELLANARTIIIPGWRDRSATVPAELIAALRQAHARGGAVAVDLLRCFRPRRHRVARRARRDHALALYLGTGRALSRHPRGPGRAVCRFRPIDHLRRQRGRHRCLPAPGGTGFRHPGGQFRGQAPGHVAATQRWPDAIHSNAGQSCTA